MKLAVALTASALLFSTALSGPVINVRQNFDNDDQVLYSPANGTTISSGGSLNFTYQSSDDDTTAVRVALVRIIEVERNVPVTAGADGRRRASQQLTLPANLAPGRYFIAVAERGGLEEGGEGDDDDDDDEEGDEQDSNNRSIAEYDDYDFTFDYPGAMDDDEQRVYLTVSNATTGV